MSTFGTVLPPRDHVISDYSALRVQQFKQSTCKGCDSNHAVTAAANVVLLRKTGRPRLGLLTAHIMAATVTARWRCFFLLIKCFFLPIKCIPHINEYFHTAWTMATLTMIISATACSELTKNLIRAPQAQLCLELGRYDGRATRTGGSSPPEFKKT